VNLAKLGNCSGADFDTPLSTQRNSGLASPRVVDVDERFHDSIEKDEALSRELSNFVWASDDPSLLLQTELQAENSFISPCDLTMESLIAQAFSNVESAECVSDTTSLCSWAFSLLLKNNIKGYSAADLDLKLRAGYRHGAAPTEGCRIDNKVLLNVLAEIL
jgi:hypothetical protein